MEDSKGISELCKDDDQEHTDEQSNKPVPDTWTDFYGGYTSQERSELKSNTDASSTSFACDGSNTFTENSNVGLSPWVPIPTSVLTGGLSIPEISEAKRNNDASSISFDCDGSNTFAENANTWLSPFSPNSSSVLAVELTFPENSERKNKATHTSDLHSSVTTFTDTLVSTVASRVSSMCRRKETFPDWDEGKEKNLLLQGSFIAVKSRESLPSKSLEVKQYGNVEIPSKVFKESILPKHSLTHSSGSSTSSSALKFVDRCYTNKKDSKGFERLKKHQGKSLSHLMEKNAEVNDPESQLTNSEKSPGVSAALASQNFNFFAHDITGEKIMQKSELRTLKKGSCVKEKCLRPNIDVSRYLSTTHNEKELAVKKRVRFAPNPEIVSSEELSRKRSTSDSKTASELERRKKRANDDPPALAQEDISICTSQRASNTKIDSNESITHAMRNTISNLERNIIILEFIEAFKHYYSLSKESEKRKAIPECGKHSSTLLKDNFLRRNALDFTDASSVSLSRVKRSSSECSSQESGSDKRKVGKDKNLHVFSSSRNEIGNTEHSNVSSNSLTAVFKNKLSPSPCTDNKTRGAFIEKDEQPKDSTPSFSNSVKKPAKKTYSESDKKKKNKEQL